MTKRIVVLVVVLVAIGAGSLSGSAYAAPQASKLAWIGDPAQPDDVGEPDEPSSLVVWRNADLDQPGDRYLGDPAQPGDGLLDRILVWIHRIALVIHA